MVDGRQVLFCGALFFLLVPLSAGSAEDCTETADGTLAPVQATAQIGRRLSTLQLIRQFIPDYTPAELEHDDEAGDGESLSTLLNSGLADSSRYDTPAFQSAMRKFMKCVELRRGGSEVPCSQFHSDTDFPTLTQRGRASEPKEIVPEVMQPKIRPVQMNALGVLPEAVSRAELPAVRTPRSRVDSGGGEVASASGGIASRGVSLPSSVEASAGDESYAPLSYDTCFTKAFLPVAGRRAAGYGRSRSAGNCAKAVRKMLGDMGFARAQYGLGHAIDYYRRPRANSGSMQELGFKNYLPEINMYLDQQQKPLTDESRIRAAPPGSILVFSGPQSPRYLRNGRILNWDQPGDSVGHVTVKADENTFYTDAITRTAVGRNRTLIGIYLNPAGRSYQDRKVRNRRAEVCNER